MTTLNDLHVALRKIELARFDCPHWDFESDGDDKHECCYKVNEAELAYQKARKAVTRRA